MKTSAVDRPSFRLAIACSALLAAGVPACFGMVITPWSRWGIEAFITGIWAGLIVGAITSVPIALGLRHRPRWWRRWASASFGILIAAWGITCAVGLLYPLGLVPLRPGPLGNLAPVGWTGLVFLVALALPAWWLARTLRDPGWRGCAA